MGCTPAAGGASPTWRSSAIPIAEVSEDGTAVITKTPGSGGRVDVGTVSEQMVYEILDPANYLTADVTADFSGFTLEQVDDRTRCGSAAPPAELGPRR